MAKIGPLLNQIMDVQRTKSNLQKASSTPAKAHCLSLFISGMTCNFCATTIESELKKHDGKSTDDLKNHHAVSLSYNLIY